MSKPYTLSRDPLVYEVEPAPPGNLGRYAAKVATWKGHDIIDDPWWVISDNEEEVKRHAEHRAQANRDAYDDPPESEYEVKVEYREWDEATGEYL